MQYSKAQYKKVCLYMPLIGSYSVKDHKNDQHNYLYIYKYYKYNVYVFVINLFVICWNNRIKNHNRR